MVSSPEHSPMAKRNVSRNRASSLTNYEIFLYIGGALMALLLVWSFFSIYIPHPNFNPKLADSKKTAYDSPIHCSNGVDLRFDPENETFYDDPKLSYSIDKPPVQNWDEKRKQWLNLHPSFKTESRHRILMITGSQPGPCKNPAGDNLLLRSFKNKVDYARLHGIEIFYINSLLHPKMGSYWAKLPVIRAAMLAHPETEWIWWVDSDAVFTDMEYELPLRRYDSHNIVVHGWGHEIYDKQSWTALNAGVFLIRNCQWSIDFIQIWAKMGPMSPDFRKWGQLQKSVFKNKLFSESDDQTALIYLLYKYKDRYYSKIYLEGEYYLEGYWLEIVPKFDNVTEYYLEMERNDKKLRRRHAEKVSEHYGALRENEHLKGAFGGQGSKRRPFMTHFTGCQPCNGDHNEMYSGKSCVNGMIRALNFADNQVMRTYGFMHSDLLKNSPLEPIAFDYPDEGPW